MNDGQHETPATDSTKARISPRVVLAAAGVVVATLFATVAALTGSQEATPASRSPLEDVVSKSTLRSAPALTSSTAPSKAEVDALSSVEAPPTTTTTPRRTKVTTVTQPDGTTTTTTVEDTTPVETSKPPTKTTTAEITTTTSRSTPPTTTQPTTTTTEPTVPPSSNDGTGQQ